MQCRFERSILGPTARTTTCALAARSAQSGVAITFHIRADLVAVAHPPNGHSGAPYCLSDRRADLAIGDPLRCGDLALYQDLGINTTDSRTIKTIEHLTLITIGGTTGLLLALTIARIQNQRIAAIDHGLWTALTSLAATLTITAAASFTTRHGNPLEQLKDR
jgi:hypothetical protein